MPPRPYIGLSGVYARIQRACTEAGSQRAWAARIGVGQSAVSKVLSAKAMPCARMLKDLKLTRATVFFEKE